MVTLLATFLSASRATTHERRRWVPCPHIISGANETAYEFINPGFAP